jgi:SWI/SNF-related matrix-associated actin-dependent regulator of chromatin subfamily A3
MKCEGAGSENLRLLLDSICLRRSKNLLDLPDITDEYRVLDFSDAERQQYDAAEKEMSQAIKDQANFENSKKGYFGIFQLEMRLRRLCNHGTFQRSFPKVVDDDLAVDQQETATASKERDSSQCGYCHQNISRDILVDHLFNGHFTVCGHLICSACLPLFEQQLAISRKSFGLQCPLCDTRLDGDYLLNEKPRRDNSEEKTSPIAQYFRNSGVSSKVQGLLQDIEKNTSQEKRYVDHDDI